LSDTPTIYDNEAKVSHIGVEVHSDSYKRKPEEYEDDLKVG
jgi:hypothetical protein